MQFASFVPNRLAVVFTAGAVFGYAVTELYHCYYPRRSSNFVCLGRFDQKKEETKV